MCTIQSNHKDTIEPGELLASSMVVDVLGGTTDAPNDSHSIIEDRVRAHDGGVIEELIVLHGKRLRSFLIRLTGDVELSEDLLQETWIRVLARGSQFKGESKLSTWLFAIARNLVFDLRRTRSFAMQSAVRVDDDIENDLQSRDKSPFDCCLEGDEAIRPDQALRGLAPKQRKVIKLRYYCELSLGEVAKATGMSLGNVKSTLYRSVVLLRSGTLLDGAVNMRSVEVISKRHPVCE